MRFVDIPLTAGETTPEPRAAPADVPEKAIFQVPQTLVQTDKPPGTIWLTLEGTVGNTVAVQLYVLADSEITPFQQSDSVKDGRAAREFYLLNAVAQTITVGEMAEFSEPAVPGTLYARVSTGPVAPARLRIGFGQ